MRNLLGEASSPYLLQHRDNPVHWQVWGPEALATATQADKPILLSIGYAACHWCHVMAHESFEDSDTAALMNEHFISIKVDREERPDIDQIYMAALHALGEQGGWPLTMFLTPQGEPFWGGTYFPPSPRFGRPSFRQVLLALHQAWHADRAQIGQTAASMARALTANAASSPGALPTPAALDDVRQAFLRNIDWQHGGLGQAPKFPNAPVFRFLWQEAFRTRDRQAADAVDLLLLRMSQGGIYDHLGGGYARYATDSRWLIPHFEKMLYDNALILDLLALVHAHTGNALYAARAAETVQWLLRDMREEGAFAASEDADSEGQEGKFYVWTLPDIRNVLGTQTAFFARHYDLPEHGNWEETIILERRTPLADAATEAGLAACRALLLEHRAQRIRPGRDDKVLADWNALMVAALARASMVFNEPRWLTEAENAFDFILRTMANADGRISHAYRAGRISAAGLIEDQAAMIRAALALHEATGEAGRLAQARRILDAAEANFSDGAGAFFTTAHDATDLPAGDGFRVRSAADGPTPSGIGLMAENYARLYHLTGEAGFREKAEGVLGAFGGRRDRLPASPVLLAAADMLENAACIVITSEPGPMTLRHAALAAPDPAAVVLAVATGAELPAEHPAHGKSSNTPAAFICQAGVCAPSVATAAELRAGLRQIAKT